MRLTIVLFLLALFCSVASGNGDTTPHFGETECSGCTEPGHFCGIDGVCHEFSCQNYYQYADRLLTGYADNATLECFGYADGDKEYAHGVVYGCNPLFPFVLMTPGKQVTEPFNQKCTAEREGGYKFECYEFQPSETATDFTSFQQEAESFFPDCGEGITPKYFYNIASSNRYMGVEGLQGNPIVVGGADADGDTIWQTNNATTFSREIAMKSMYANVIGGPSPSSTSGATLGTTAVPSTGSTTEVGGSGSGSSGGKKLLETHLLATVVGPTIVALWWHVGVN